MDLHAVRIIKSYPLQATSYRCVIDQFNVLKVNVLNRIAKGGAYCPDVEASFLRAVASPREQKQQSVPSSADGADTWDFTYGTTRRSWKRRVGLAGVSHQSACAHTGPSEPDEDRMRRDKRGRVRSERRVRLRHSGTCVSVARLRGCCGCTAVKRVRACG